MYDQERENYMKSEQLTQSMICITNRKLCKEPFLTRIELVAKSHPKAIILREKDLSEAEYEELAAKVEPICDMYGVPLIYHSHPDLAIARNKGLHMPLNALEKMLEADRKKCKLLGASCHSTEDADKAISLGCTYIIAGHIYDTDCKKGIPGRGTGFLKNLCEHVHIPVYAIGGITPSKLPEIISCGASGGCMMSGYMTGEI